MKTLNTRRRFIALVPLVVIAILSIGNRTRATQDQGNIVVQGGIIIQGGITHGQILRFNVGRLATVVGGPPNTNSHPGGMNLELTVFDSQGNAVASHLFQFPDPGQNQGNNTWRSQSFDLNADQLTANTYDNAGRAQLAGIIRQIPGPHQTVNPGPLGIVGSGEIFNFGDGNGNRTLTYISGIPISESR